MIVGLEQRITEKAKRELRRSLDVRSDKINAVIVDVAKKDGELRDACMAEVARMNTALYEKLEEKFIQQSIDMFIGFSEDEDEDEEDEDEDEDEWHDEDEPDQKSYARSRRLKKLPPKKRPG